MFNATLASNPEYQDAFDTIVQRVKDNGTAQTDQEAITYAINAIAPELGYDPKSIVVGSGRNEGTGVPDSYYQLPEGMSEQDRFKAVNTAYQDAYDKAIRDGSTPKEAEEKAIAAAWEKNSEVASTTKRSGENRAEKNSPTGSGARTNNRPGADAALEDVMNPPAMDANAYAASKRAGYEYNGSTSSGTSGTSGSGTSGSGSSSYTGPKDKNGNPKGTVYSTPSYGQSGQVVKLPYKSGGYTEDELKKAGNNSWGTKYGSNVYEGYYKAPDGNYYPVDQEKAAYYKANGGSYEGWEEPMREYYKTFGTYYGYRPDWKTAGRSSYGGYSYSPRSYSYSRGGNSYGGSSYGSGSPANNGLYWNPNSSWSI
jgi:hypothetical protein